MTVRDIIREIDLENGRSETVSAEASALADKMFPNAGRVLDRELAPEEIEPMRLWLREIKSSTRNCANEIIRLSLKIAKKN